VKYSSSALKPLLKKIPQIKIHPLHIHFSASVIFATALVITVLLLGNAFKNYKSDSEKSLKLSSQENKKLAFELNKTKKEFLDLKSTDQVKRNDELEATIKNIEKTYDGAILVYEHLTDLPATSKDLPKFRKSFSQVLRYLKDKNYASGSAELSTLDSDISAAQSQYVASLGGVDVSSLPVNNAPPGSGYSRQRVDVSGGSYLVDLIAADISSTNVYVDTASDSDCSNNCPVLSLGDYVSRNGAFAGVNGSYFCPADYPSCAGKSNSFDTLAMNRKKHYFNSDNNVYSTVPAVIFGDSFVRFVGRSSDWGRDTGVNGVLANQPLLVSGGNVVFGGDGDPKKGSKGNRSFVANKGNTVYIGVAYNVTVAESALVLKAMGMENALNLDSGGSTALFANGGYKAGPGRGVPNAIVFVRK